MITPNQLSTDLLLLFLFASILFSPGLLWLRGAGSPFDSLRFNRALGALLLVSLFGAMLAHLVYWASIWFDCEHGVYAIAMGWLQGMPIYHAPDAVERYSLLYGPLTYELYALGYKVFGNTLWAPKLTALLCFAGVAFLFVRQIAGSGITPVRQWFALSMVLTMLLPFGSLFYYLKGDPALLLLAAIPYAFQRPRRGLVAALVCGALAANIKLTAPVYFLPSLAYFLALMPPGSRGKTLVMGALLAAASFAAPFLQPGISAGNYLYWLKAASHHPIQLEVFNQVWRYAALPAVVVGCIFWRARHAACSAEKTLAAVLATCLLVASVLGSKQGAGAQHLLPLVPSALALVLAAFRYLPQRTPAHTGVNIGFLGWIGLAVFSIASEGIQISNGVAKETQTVGAVRELHRFVDARQGQTFSLAPADLERVESRLIVEAIAAGGKLIFTDVAMWDMDLSHEPVPASTAAYLGQCPVQYWLVAHGAVPFQANNIYTHRAKPHYSMFDANVIRSFATAYSKTAEGQYFDVWECNRSGIALRAEAQLPAASAAGAN